MSIITLGTIDEFTGPDVVDSRCTILRSDASPCGQDVPVGAPISACRQHLLDAYLYCADLLKAELTWMDFAAQPRERLADIVGPVVYYARIGSHIKIGTTTDLGARANSAGFDAVLATEPGSYDIERQRHAQFRTSRAQVKGSREYFHPSRELRDHIEQLKVADSAAGGSR